MRNATACDFLSGPTKRPLDIASLYAEQEPERYTLYARHLNEAMVRVLRTIGYDVGFRSGSGQYLFDRAGVTWTY